MSDEAQAVDTAQEPIAEPTEMVIDDSPDPVDGQVDDSPVDVVQEPIESPIVDNDSGHQAAVEAAERRAAEAEARASAYQDVYHQSMTQSQQIDAENAERERIMAMSPEERLNYAAQQTEQRLQSIAADAERRIHDANDRAAYAALKADNPMAARLEKDVEKFVTEKRAAGQNIDRDVALTWLAGEQALAAAKSGAGKKQRAQAQETITKSQAPSTNASGDKSGDRSSSGDSKAERNERLKAGKGGYR